jgi:hypothetical protein
VKPTSPVIPGMDLPEVVFAKDQPQYIPLPATIVDGGTRVITRWKLGWRERLRILFTGNLWLSLLTFGNPLQPILLDTESPKRYLQVETVVGCTGDRFEGSLAGRKVG